MPDDLRLETRFTQYENDTNPDLPIGDSSAKVDKESAAFQQMNRKWELVTDLLGGTDAMQDRGEKWLPRETKEDPEDYAIRKSHSELYDAYKDTTEKIGAKPFKVPAKLRVGDQLPAQLQGISENVDRQGNDLTSFCKNLFTESVRYGMSHVFVESPQLIPRNLKEKKEKGIRPYFIRIHPQDLFGWQFTRNESGEFILTQIRWREAREEPDPVNPYQEVVMEYVRVWTPTAWEIWRRVRGSGDYRPWRSGKHNLGKIPLVTLYTGWESFMMASPPLYGLARLNLRHYRTFSEQCNILRFCRLPVYYASGVTEKEYKDGVEFGPNSIVMSQNKDFKFGVVEHQGNAIKAGERDVDLTERRMEVFGTTPYIQRSGVQSATGRHYTETGRETLMQSWIRAGEMVMTDAYKLAAEWESSDGNKLVIPEEFKVEWFNQFNLSYRATEEIRALNEAYLADPPRLDRQTWFEELKRRDVFDEALSFEEYDRRMKKAFKEARKAKQDDAAIVTSKLSHSGDPRGLAAKENPPSPTGAGLDLKG